MRLTISETASVFEYELPDDVVAGLVNAVERDLEQIGYVVVTRAEFEDRCTRLGDV
jgi:hypothetical protein